MTNPTRPTTSLKKISRWIRDGATTDEGHPRPQLREPPPEPAETNYFHYERIQLALERARRKTFVKMPKPFRSLFRNQGAVNDSLIEAVHHLAQQNEELLEEIGELRDLVHTLGADAQPAARRDETREGEVG